MLISLLFPAFISTEGALRLPTTYDNHLIQIFSHPIILLTKTKIFSLKNNNYNPGQNSALWKLGYMFSVRRLLASGDVWTQKKVTTSKLIFKKSKSELKNVSRWYFSGMSEKPIGGWFSPTTLHNPTVSIKERKKKIFFSMSSERTKHFINEIIMY